jgi:serine protease Do
MKRQNLVIAVAAVSIGTGAGYLASQGSSSRALAAPAPQPELQNPASPGDPNIFVSLSKRIIPSVVNISTLTKPKIVEENGFPGFRSFGPDDLFRQFFAPMPGQHYKRVIPRSGALGTGFLITDDGIILTNNHVVAGADEIKIAFTESPTEKPTEAKVIGRDPELDVALIRVKTDRKLTPLPLGDSDALQVGEYVAAVGNPFGNGHSLTHGIISAKGRAAPDFPLATYLQTDAPINPGNSGGPLVNLRGEVIGINSAIDARAQGIGFAIPINAVKQILPQLESKGKVSRGYLGLLIEQINPDLAEKLQVSRDTRAPFVAHVYPQGPAAQSGLKPYDVILEANGKPVHSPSDLTSEVVSFSAGQKIQLKISRDGKTQDVTVRLGDRPADREMAREDDDG